MLSPPRSRGAAFDGNAGFGELQSPGGGTGDMASIARLKKPAMAEAAGKLLLGKGWLPVPAPPAGTGGGVKIARQREGRANGPLLLMWVLRQLATCAAIPR
jgi:hypothetical protein